MIIGNGQLANTFKNSICENAVIFASGVSDSNCTDEAKFNRERQLLISTLHTHRDKKFVYFSSCALSAETYPRNKYYQHKEEMESLIRESSQNYYIFRLPQLFGHLKKHKTLVNFIYNAIVSNTAFKVYRPAYRYVIEIDDTRLLVENYLKFSEPNITIDLANSYRYNVEEIVKTFELLLGKKGIYELVEKVDVYSLDLHKLNEFVKEHSININFGPNYLGEKLKTKIDELHLDSQ